MGEAYGADMVKGIGAAEAAPTRTEVLSPLFGGGTLGRRTLGQRMTFDVRLFHNPLGHTLGRRRL
jgi:hypothetical protein